MFQWELSLKNSRWKSLRKLDEVCTPESECNRGAQSTAFSFIFCLRSGKGRLLQTHLGISDSLAWLCLKWLLSCSLGLENDQNLMHGRMLKLFVLFDENIDSAVAD